MDVRLVLLEDRHSDIEKLFTRIGKLDKASICKIYGLTDELYNYLGIQDTSWLKKFVSMIKSFIICEDNWDDKYKQIKSLKTNTVINNDFINFFFKNKNIYDLESLIDESENNPKSEPGQVLIQIPVLKSDLILGKYPNLRKNQIAGLTQTIKQGFITGCHNHIMGSGKTIMELIHIDSHCNFVLDKKLINGSIYMFVSSRINILGDIFFNNGKKEEYKKYNVDLDKYAIIDLVYDDKKNISFSKTKPNIIVVNNQYLKKIQDDEDYFNKIIKNLKLVILDECHNVSAPNVFNFMKEIQKKSIPILGFSATPMRTNKDAKANFKSIFSIDTKVNMISTYDLFEAIIDDYILPFKIKQYEFKGIYNENVDDNSSEKVKYTKHDFDKNKLIVKKILQDEMKEVPYCKIVAWCSSIGNLMKWKEFIEEEIPELTVYIAHSGNADNPAVNEYGDFYDLKPKNKDDKTKINALLLNVSIVSEGCDIDFVDSGIFLDPVKNKNIVTYLQNAGRICRTDIYGRKTHANIIYTYLSEKKDITGQIISYFEMLLQLTEKSDDYFNKMNELVKNLKVDNKEIRIVIDKKEEHDCVMYLDREVKDWNKIKKEVEKVVRERYGVGNDILNKLNNYNFDFSKPTKCIINKRELNNPSSLGILKEVYKIIGSYEKILIVNPNIFVGNVENEYVEEINISFHRTETQKTLYEIMKQCAVNKIDIKIDIKWKNKDSELKVECKEGIIMVI